MLVKQVPDEAAVDAASNVLLRLGERCNHACPMCTNTFRPELEDVAVAEVLRRIDVVRALGFTRVVLTGGEPTIHPGFFAAAERLAEHGMPWDLNTHGRSFHRPDFAARARRLGLDRAVVSLHGATPEVANVMSGAPAVAFDQTVAGMRNLAAEGVGVTVNLVLSRLNIGALDAWLELLHRELGGEVIAKLCFPSLHSIGRDWAPVQLTLEEARRPLRRAAERARDLGLALQWESVPNCISGDPAHPNIGRLGFGETHYLDDLRGDRLYAIAAVEAAIARYHDDCAGCAAFDRCPGVSDDYAACHGLHELVPFPTRAGAWWLAPGGPRCE